MYDNQGMNSEMTLGDYLDNVHDRESFLDFVWALMRDREESIKAEKINPSSPYGPDTGGWENIYIETFLSAALQCHNDAPKRLPEEPSWKSFAEFLYCGKIYE